MTFLRRGNVSFPHVGKAAITLTRIGDMPIKIRLADISCFEEKRFRTHNPYCQIFFTNGSNLVVEESFDEVNAACRKWEVANV